MQSKFKISAARTVDRRKRLPVASALGLITGAHLCMASRAASGLATTESRRRADIMAAPERVILIEGCAPHAVRAAADGVAAAIGALIEAGGETGLYRLEYQC